MEFLFGGRESIDHYKSPSTDLPLKYHEIILSLRDELQKTNVITKVEYVGSAYKGTRIDDSDMDNLFIKRDFAITERDYGDGYAYLYRNGEMLKPATTINAFRSKVHKALNSLGYANNSALAEHGPALEMRYSDGNVKFCIDLVFGYEIDDGESYIAKPPTDATGNETYLWKYSTALEEKRYMSIIDKDNKVSRWAVRFIKALIKSDAPLQVITSYVVEQSLYHLRDQHPAGFWVESNMKEIIRVLLRFTADAIEKRDLRNYFNSRENVIPRMSEVTRGNVVNRLRRLSKDPLLQKVMDTVSPEKKVTTTESRSASVCQVEPPATQDEEASSCVIL